MPDETIFAPYRRIPRSKITKLRTLMLLYGLHLCFNFVKIRSINDRLITQKYFGTKNHRKMFSAPRSDPKIIACDKNSTDVLRLYAMFGEAR